MKAHSDDGCYHRLASAGQGFHSKHKLALLTGGIVFLCSFFCGSVRAQDTATIVGTVTDPSGAAIPGVKVTVSNSDKGFTREVATNAVGAYAVAAAPIGNYTVSAQVAGLQKSIRNNLVLTVGLTQRVDFQLSVGRTT
ncbi:MAG TPA: carboxypeptidase-like regulatory domain-containing protein [Terriglobia bacterium]|nr:carboxypeptidase-like regulatory domain-containing protein [Terriglobia bacterium]